MKILKNWKRESQRCIIRCIDKFKMIKSIKTKSIKSLKTKSIKGTYICILVYLVLKKWPKEYIW